MKKIGLAMLAVLLTGGALLAQGNLHVGPGRQSIVPMRPDIVDLPPFFSNLVVDPCTACNYDSAAGGYYVWGSTNCELTATIQYIAIPFVAARAGVPRRLEASVVNDVCGALNTFNLGIWSDACSGGISTGPNAPLTGGTGVAKAPAAPCALAVANLRAGPTLVAGTTYWLVASSIETGPQANPNFSGIWYAANTARIGGEVGAPPWFVFSGLSGAGAVL
jgi:hypothetical protein